MFHLFVQAAESFMSGEQHDNVRRILDDDEFMDGIVCPLHKAAIRTPHIIGEYKSYKQVKDFRPITEEERQKMVMLERNLDFCVLKSRLDNPDVRDGNENNSLKQESGRTCGQFGDIAAEVYALQFEEEEADIRAACSTLGMSYIDFPAVDMRNEFSIHWSRSDMNCLNNSFRWADAKKFAMNHYKYDFERYKRLRKSGETSKEAFETVVTEENASNWHYKIKYSDKRAILTSFEHEFKLQRRQNIKAKNVRHIFFDKPREYDVQVTFTPKEIASRYGSTIETETLGIDSRLLNVQRFANLDCPPICIPSILRDGKADFHCVYFEGPDTMGKLENWVTIIIVREDQRDEYVHRYASPHTYFVSLEDREPKTKLMISDKKAVANTKGYSAGDSKYYCWRIANWLHTLWNTPSEKRRCVIMDDQVAPFGHEVPRISQNVDLAPKSKKFQYYSTNKKNNQYRFRTSLKDRKGHSMMYGGNTRWYLTHAATFMYMNSVCDIMDAAIVCMTSTVSGQDLPLSTNPKSNVVWFIDLAKMNAAMHTGDEHHIECGIHPAYQAGEDLFMHVINKNRKLRSVNVNTIRWRSETTGGGTCGRGGVKPFQPIIKYHELATVLHYNTTNVSIRKVSKMPRLTTKNSKYQIRSLTPVYKMGTIVYKVRANVCKEQLLQIWLEKNGVIFKANIQEDAVKPCWFGDNNIVDSELSIFNAYAPRHIFTNLAVHLLAQCQTHGQQDDEDDDGDEDDGDEDDGDGETKRDEEEGGGNGPSPVSPLVEEGYVPPWDYVVKKQERLRDIAKRTGFDINDLILVNDGIKGLKASSILRTGTELMYPRYVEYSSEPEILGEGLDRLHMFYNEKLQGNRTVVFQIAIMHHDQVVDVVLKMFAGSRYAIEKELDISQLGYSVQNDIKLYYTGIHSTFDGVVLKSIYDEFFGSGTVGVIIMTGLNTLADAIYKYRDVRSARYPKFGLLKKKKQGGIANWQHNTHQLIQKLHNVGIVHGDLKYGNVFINESDDDDLGKVYIIDFERSFIKQDASFQDEWDALPHNTQTDINRRNKTCLRDMRDLFKEKIV